VSHVPCELRSDGRGQRRDDRWFRGVSLQRDSAGQALRPQPGARRESGEMSNVTQRRVVSHEEWVAERKALLAKEKEFTRLRDEARGGATYRGSG
jgi:Bacterial protein of unknown function (DUF899)